MLEGVQEQHGSWIWKLGAKSRRPQISVFYNRGFWPILKARVWGGTTMFVVYNDYSCPSSFKCLHKVLMDYLMNISVRFHLNET